MSEQLPDRVYLRIAGGGVTLPGGRPYRTLVGDDREQAGRVEYVRADLAATQAGAEVGVRDLATFLLDTPAQSATEMARALLAEYRITKRD